jgi:hypothetical protein
MLGLSIGYTGAAASRSAAAHYSQEQVTNPTQSSAQKQKDMSECYELAKKRTGFDPGALGLSEYLLRNNSRPAQSAVEALKQAGSADASAPAPAISSRGPSAADDKQNQQNMDAFRAANDACLQARGYAKPPATETEPAPKK